MHHHYLKKWLNSSKEVFLHPKAFFTKMKKRDEFEHSFKFALTTLLVVGVLEVIIFDWLMNRAFMTAPFWFVIRLAIRLAIFHLFTGFAHIMLWLFGTQHKYQDTFHTMAHFYPVPMISSLLLVLLNIISAGRYMQVVNGVSIATIAYIIYVQTTGLSISHKMHPLKVFAATILVPVLVALVFLYIAAVFLPIGMPQIAVQY